MKTATSVKIVMLSVAIFVVLGLVRMHLETYDELVISLYVHAYPATAG
jgi:hypothetical protein